MNKNYRMQGPEHLEYVQWILGDLVMTTQPHRCHGILSTAPSVHRHHGIFRTAPIHHVFSEILYLELRGEQGLWSPCNFQVLFLSLWLGARQCHMAPGSEVLRFTVGLCGTDFRAGVAGTGSG